jgi:DNA-binding PadR family transcriptional regulator
MATAIQNNALQSSLTRILQSVKSSTAASSENMKMYAEQNNASVQKMLRDVYRVFSSNSKTNAEINSNIAEQAAETQRFSGKIDNTNSLLQQTLSIQSVMLSEIRNLNNSLTRMFVGGGVGGGTGSGGGAAALAALAGLGGLGYLATRQNNNQNAAPNTPNAGGNRSGARLNTEEQQRTAQAIVDKSGSDDMAKVLLGNAQRESSLIPTKVNSGTPQRPESSHGILQLNRRGGEGVAFDRMFPRKEGEPDPIYDPAKQMEYFEKAAKSRKALIDGQDTGQTLWDYMNDPRHSLEMKNKAYYQNFAKGANAAADMRISMQHINNNYRNVKKGEQVELPGAKKQQPAAQQTREQTPPSPEPAAQRTQEQPQQPQQNRQPPSNLRPPGEAPSMLPTTPGGTMQRMGVEKSIGSLHPDLRSKLQSAIEEAKQAGIDASIFSAYRPPEYGVGGFGDKMKSLHSYGLAVDVAGLGGAGSEKARKWYEIATKHGLYNPYGYNHPREYNHYQLVPYKSVEPDNPLRNTITPAGPKNLQEMWDAADQTRTQRGSELQPSQNRRAETIDNSSRTAQQQYGPDPTDPSRSVPMIPDQQFVPPQQTAAYNPAIDGNMFNTGLYNPLAPRFSWPLQVLAEFGGSLLKA